MLKSLRVARSILEILLLLIAAGSGIVVTACVIITKGDFGGRCLLYGYLTESRLTNGRMTYAVAWNGMANCQFVIIVQAFASIFALINIAVQACFLQKRKIHGTSFVPLLFTGLYTVSWTLILVSSCILSAGFKAYCDSWLNSLGNEHLSCEDVQRIQWTHTPSINGSRFYNVLSVAQTATWISFTVWMLLPLVAWSGVRFVSNRRQEQASEVPT